MLTSFPAPVLSVAADAVRELEGTDALYGLWTLFTKCKESLQDGRRLENISWRLWFREMAKASSSRHLDPNEKSFALEDQKFDEKQFRPLTPDEVHQLSTPTVSEDAHGISFFSSASVIHHAHPVSRSPKSFSALSQSPSQFSDAVPITRRRLSSTRSGSFATSSGALSVGKIICDMLPNADSSEQRSLSSSFSNFNNPTLDLRQNVQAPEPDTRPTLCFIPTPVSTFLPPCLPTPGTEEGDIDASFYESAITPTLTPQLSTSPPSVLVSFPSPVNPVTSIFALPTLLEEPTSQSQSLPDPLLPPDPPPRLVVVNPTPNPTPHPTPPATPDLNPGIRSAMQGSQFLTLPNARQFTNLLHIPLSASRPRASSARSLHRLDAEDAEISELSYPQNLTPGSNLGEVSGEAEPSRLGMVPEEPQPTTAPGNTNAGSPPRDWTTSTHRHSLSSTTTTSSSSQASSVPSTTTASTADESAKALEELGNRKGSGMSSSSSKRSSISGTISQSRSSVLVSPPALASSPGSVKKKRHSMPVQSTAGSSSALSSTGRSGSLSPSKAAASPPQKGVRPSTGLIRRASSGGGSASGSSKSRSRSRDAGIGLVMTRTAAKTAGGAKVKRPILGARVSRGRSVLTLARKQSQGEGEDRENDMIRQKKVREETIQKELERRDLEREREFEREQEREVKRLAKFNFGSNSEGSAMGSKSAGSGSEASGMVMGPTDRDQAQPAIVDAVIRGIPGDQNLMWKGKEKERDYQVQQMLKYDDREKERTREKEKERGRQEREKARLDMEDRAGEKTVKTREKSNDAAATAAKVQRSLADPLLPLNQRRVVLATSESDYETDSDFDEDGSWSSEALSTEYVDVPVPRRQAPKPSLLRPEVPPREPQAPQLSPRHQPSQPAQPPQPPQQPQQPQPPQPPLQPIAPPPQRQLSPRRAAAPQRPPGPQRTNSGAYQPGNAAAHATARQRQQANRVQHQRQEQRQAAQAARALFEATAELQRQQDMFTKLPTSSFQNLNGEVQRTKSVGLLSQLMKPDPEIFPPNHPYRRGFSFSELNPSAQQQLVAQREAAIRQQEAQLLVQNHATANGQSHLPPPLVQQSQAPLVQPSARPLPRQHAPMPTLSRTLSKSSIAGPVASQVQAAGMERSATAGFLGMGVVKGAWSAMVGRGGKAGSSSAAHAATGAGPGGIGGAADARVNEEVIGPDQAPVVEHLGSAGPDVSSGKYRPRARPENMELEDESDTEMDRIQISTSVANERIKALTERRAPTRRQTSDGAVLQRAPQENHVPAWVHEPRQPELPQQIAAQLSAPIMNQQIQLPQIVPFSTAIPVDHPYNFPLPPPPATPVTIRRTMLKDELTESMRRQILWQRHVGKANPIRRTTSGGGSRNNVLGGLQPLTTAMPNVVQLTAKGSSGHAETNAVPTGRDDTHASSGSATHEAERSGRDARSEDEERKRHAMARNRSWAGDFHHAGW